MLFQYVGDGNFPPEKIDFMGKVKFKLHGKAVDVDDAEVIEKLLGNKCFKAKYPKKPKGKLVAPLPRTEEQMGSDKGAPGVEGGTKKTARKKAVRSK